MIPLYRAVTLLFIGCLAQTPASGQLPISALRTDGEITIDAVLSEQTWHRPGFDTFRQRDPNEGAIPSERTEIWVAYNGSSLYIAGRMYDSAPESLTVRLSRRDGSYNSDTFWFFVDPYNDGRTGFYFALDAAGTYYDGTLHNDADGWSNSTWDGVWEGKVRIDSLGWTAEMRIPFSQLRFQDSDSLVWGVNFARQIARRNEADYVAFTPKGGSGFVSRFPKLAGLNGVHAPFRFEALPYMTARAEYLQHAPGDPFNDGAQYVPGIGIDLKMGLGSSITLDGTINPDFGQVDPSLWKVNRSSPSTDVGAQRVIRASIGRAPRSSTAAGSEEHREAESPRLTLPIHPPAPPSSELRN
jgi:hypothetical protein